MGIFDALKNFIQRVEEVDRKSKILSAQKYCSSNPFAFKKNQTYVWVDSVEKKKKEK